MRRLFLDTFSGVTEKVSLVMQLVPISKVKIRIS
nr:MAG TPA: hypothetical protein [Caudoviricetes sp.]